MIYERIKYPDSQISAKITDFSEAIIKERINNYEDLFFIRSLADICNYSGYKVKLFISCLLGQRSDRRFSPTQSFDLKLIAEIINSCNFNNVEILDPHSDVALALINNSEKVSSFQYVKSALEDIVGEIGEIGRANKDDIVLVAPDAGAYKKVFEYGEKLNLPVVGAMKHRTGDGKISMVFAGGLLTGKHCLIVDDLCDGGATFLALATKLREYGTEKVYLYITHGIFSKGFTELRKVIDHIYCTNSVKDLPLSITDENGHYTVSDYVTQYKVI